ncbi:MAG TPA: NAD-dependent epimerase/dehydratase family protein, partial [Blastocatellia bacterium]|nr:NAD-dependent epimerase/dehydratase family protein [Blastocatellia bacterium]
MKILMTGVTGLIGRSLSRSLAGAGHEVIGLSRAPEKARGVAVAEMHGWDPLSGPPPAEALKDVGAVVHLAGESIAARRWTDEQKRRIRDSRVISTRNLVEAIRRAQPRPEVFVSGSAVGLYGDTGDRPVDEDSPAGVGFLSDVCKEWEAEAEAVRDLSVRLVLVRTGVVLSPEDGALKKMLPPFKLGVAG